MMITEMIDNLRKQLMTILSKVSEVDRLDAVNLHDVWIPGVEYEAGSYIQHNNHLYQVVLSHTALEHQPPDGVGMLAIYRPVVKDADGTIDNPIPFAVGMDCYNGRYYTYNDKLYLCKADLIPCIWAPDTPGLWQWEVVTNE